MKPTPNVALRPGDYVLATKYHDGDPADPFVVGFFAGMLPKIGGDRYLVNDASGNPFRANGFRRARRISARRGAWLVARMAEIERLAYSGCRRSVWGWARIPMRENENDYSVPTLLSAIDRHLLPLAKRLYRLYCQQTKIYHSDDHIKVLWTEPGTAILWLERAREMAEIFQDLGWRCPSVRGDLCS